MNIVGSRYLAVASGDSSVHDSGFCDTPEQAAWLAISYMQDLSSDDLLWLTVITLRFGDEWMEESYAEELPPPEAYVLARKFEKIGPLEEEGDDVCDICMRSGVNVLMVTADGRTVCDDCAEDWQDEWDEEDGDEG